MTSRRGPDPSVANPKFVSPLERGSDRISDSKPHEQLIESRVVYGFEVPERGCHGNDRNFKSTTLAAWFRALSPFPPYERPAPKSPDKMEFVGKDEQSQRGHPEAEHRQEPEDTKNDQNRPDEHPQRTRARHRVRAAENMDPVSGRRPVGLMSIGHCSFHWRQHRNGLATRPAADCRHMM